jgi:histidyl-tRNA synthetase
VALRHLRHQVGGGGRDDDQIGVAGEADMPGIELALGIEQVGVAALVCERSRSAA